MSSKPPSKDGINQMWWAARHPPADPALSFAGQTVLITGANVGLGFEAAVKFAALGAARLCLAVRSLARGQEAQRQICQRTGFSVDNIKLYKVDMSSFTSVKSFASTIIQTEPRLDVAVLNAGVAMPAFKLSPEGYELSLQVNVLSTALLALLLLPHLRRSAEPFGGTTPHLQLVGSQGHRFVTADVFDFTTKDRDAPIVEHFNNPKLYGIQSQYVMSKLLLMYVMDGLVSASAASPPTNGKPDVIITTTCPGLCGTNIGREFSVFAKLANYTFLAIFARTAEQGSRTLVSGATLGEDANGEFWSNDIFDRKGEMVKSEQGKVLAKRVWKEVIDILRQHVPADNVYIK